MLAENCGSGELIFACGDDQLKHKNDALCVVVGLAVGAAVRAENEVAAAVGKAHQVGAGALLDGQRAGQVEAAVDELFGAEAAAFGLQPLDKRLDARLGGVAHLVDGEVDAFGQDAAVDPFLAGVPTLDRGRVEQLLAHQFGGIGVVRHAGGRRAPGPDQLENAGDQFGRAFDLSEAGRLEEAAVEERAQDVAHLSFRFQVGVRQELNRIGILGRLDIPGGDLRLVGDEEVVEMAGDETGGSRLRNDDVDDVVAVEVAGAAEEGLLAVIVVIGAEVEMGGIEAVGVDGRRLREGPAGEGACAVLDVVLRVVAHAHREQFQQFASIVLVGFAFAVLVVVQPVDHGRVHGEFEQYGAHIAHADAAEQIDLVVHRHDMLALGISGGKDMMPEERHLLFQRAFAVDHAVDPRADVDLRVLRRRSSAARYPRRWAGSAPAPPDPRRAGRTPVGRTPPTPLCLRQSRPGAASGQSGPDPQPPCFPPYFTSVASGRWPVVGGRWSVVGGRWSVVGGRWSVVGGRCGF